MKPRWFAFCYTCGAYHVLETRKRLREWRKSHQHNRVSGKLHQVMLYRIDKFTVVW